MPAIAAYAIKVVSEGTPEKPNVTVGAKLLNPLESLVIACDPNKSTKAKNCAGPRALNEPPPGVLPVTFTPALFVTKEETVMGPGVLPPSIGVIVKGVGTMGLVIRSKILVNVVDLQLPEIKISAVPVPDNVVWVLFG